MNENLLEAMKQMKMTDEEIRQLEIKMITLADQVEEEFQEEQEYEFISFDDIEEVNQ